MPKALRLPLSQGWHPICQAQIFTLTFKVCFALPLPQGLFHVAAGKGSAVGSCFSVVTWLGLQQALLLEVTTRSPPPGSQGPWVSVMWIPA